MVPASPPSSSLASPSVTPAPASNHHTASGPGQRPLNKPPPKKMKRKDQAVAELLKARQEDREQFAHMFDKIGEVEDETDLFFKSISLTVKRMNQDVANELKTKIFSLVMQYESINRHRQDLQSTSSSGASYCSTPVPEPEPD
ncbi:unnamed protein product [Acanthoscelides obtectus]|uniref:BESS domain-containing protein n=1 Tax=Acanthoscelides obtectus TaxID=200917 RepID=A0A9P0LUJ2_ACAOB|nr:unnamed protein product [Acanthoscelides obtectus]CAK1641091.1 hypothetical protein AOBTE_LOCUS12144 [Acanthoscelides obtectus]